MNMWFNVDVKDMLLLKYKKGLGRPKKLMFREHDETGSKTRRPGVAYRRTKFDNFGHNSRKSQRKKHCPKTLKRKVIYHCFENSIVIYHCIWKLTSNLSLYWKKFKEETIST